MQLLRRAPDSRCWGLIVFLTLALGIGSICQAFTLVHPNGPFKYTNPKFYLMVDGKFTDGFVGGLPVGEWEGILPLVYDNRQSNPTATTVPLNWSPGDPRGTVYAPVGLGHGSTLEEFYLLMAVTGYTTPIWSMAGLGGSVAEIHFGGDEPGTLSILRSSEPDMFDFIFSLDNVIDSGKDAEEYGIEAAAMFSPSPLSPDPHLVIEVSMPVDVAPGFGDINNNGMLDGDEVFPPTGLTGLVKPTLQQITASYFVDGTEIPAIDMLASYDRLGFATISANHLVIPEPSASILLTLALLAAISVTRRRTLASVSVPVNHE